MPYYKNSGVELYYEVHGHGAALVFSHGMGGSIESVRDLVDGLPARVILYDNRGHGRSREFGHPPMLSFSRMADDIVLLLDYLGVNRAFVGGVSMGAGVAVA